MNWETEQVDHFVSGNFGYAHYEYWSAVAWEILEEHAGEGRDAVVNVLVQRLEAELSDPLGVDAMGKCFGDDRGTVGDLYHAFVQGDLGEVDWKAVARTMIETAEGE